MKNKINQKETKNVGFLKYIGVAFGVVLLSSWSPKISSLVISHQQELKGNVFKEITGIVKTEDGDPIPGVTVLKIGTNQGTETDIEGRYTITAIQGDRIQFVYEGFKTTTVTVSQSNILNITIIEDKDFLSDIMVDGYRTTSKETIGCAGVFYKSKTIEEYVKEQNIVSTTVTSRILCGGWPATRNFTQLLLQAQIPGLVILPSDYLETNRNPETILKDVENLTSNGNYVYIVDGMRVSEETFRSLNQNDVESIDVYKHSDITQALYGNKDNQSRIALESR
ncbi:CarboxypepD_reg-like domain-containing protein [Paenimyroides aquimaris]|uniref:CarboxypepD_reg-like domain-containing protein n=1 Tax=Paenimyroides marinum TaxID=1159016 RepID=A0A1H6MEY8_9FLAO|nr:carboxypeptidase-like regulatory domain-containing protein [Paenimyroides aquimaris]SEH96408.1 CarboxypepD_reg-like domain-containing protein [Paenimyroides aquimaris]